MLALLKPHQYSVSMRNVRVSADSWNRMIAHPMIKDSKDETPLIIWGNMTKEVEVAPEDMRPRCTGDNIQSIYALQVDYDSGLTIAQFQRDYARYSYQLYTSYSYGFKQGDRFRVIFPLAEPIYIDWLVAPVKEILHSFAPEADPTCWDRGHWQCLPCIRSADAPYVYEQHQGERLSFARDNFAELASEYKEGAHWRKEISEADRDPNANHTGALRKAQELIGNAVEGERNRTMWSTLCWLKSKVGADYGEVVGLTPPVGMEEEFRSMVDRLFMS